MNGTVTTILSFLLILGMVAVYIIPTIVAAARGHHQTGAIAVLNIALGWTFIGWIAALVWSCSALRQPERPIYVRQYEPRRGTGQL